MNRSLALAYKHETLIFFFGILCLSAMAMSYVWCVQNSVKMVALREDLEEANIELATEISSLETAYLEKTSGITIETAYSLGFVDDAKYVAYALPVDVGPTLGQVSIGDDL